MRERKGCAIRDINIKNAYTQLGIIIRSKIDPINLLAPFYMKNKMKIPMIDKAETRGIPNTGNIRINAAAADDRQISRV